MTPFGAELRRLRGAAGLSLAQLATRVHYSKGHLSKVELGLKTPSEALARLCDAALEAGGKLAALNRPPDDARGIESWPDSGGASDPATGLTACLDVDGIGHGFQTAADLDATTAGFRAIFDRCRDLGRQISPTVLLETLGQHTRTVHSLAVSARDAGRSRRLLRLAARFAELTGWMAQEAGDDQDAITWTESAVRLASAGGDADLQRYALVRRAEIALYHDDATRTVDLARLAQGDTGVSARVRALAAQREAQGHALAGAHDECMRALERATQLALFEVGADEEGPLLGSTSLVDSVPMITGWALYDLGRPGPAAQLIGSQLPGIPTSSTRARTRYGIRQALAHCAAGEVDTACWLAVDLLDDVRAVDSATVRVELVRLVRALARWNDQSVVRHVQPLLLAALAPERSP